MILLLLLQSAPAVQSVSDYQWLASLGVGGVLAGGMFIAYRADRKASEDRADRSEQRIADLTRDFREIVQDNTRAMVSLIDVIKEQRRPLFARKKSDD